MAKHPSSLPAAPAQTFAGASRRATRTLLSKIRTQAKALAAAGQMSHSEALELGARQAGFDSWHQLQSEHQRTPSVQAQTGHMQRVELPVDPVLPQDFDNTPNEQRSAQELDTWWDRPFALSAPGGGYSVRCLDGGAWDRSTSYGHAPDLQAATELARRKLAWSQSMRAKPVSYFAEAGKVLVVRMPQRPDQDMEVLATCASAVEAATRIEALELEAAQLEGNGLVAAAEKL